MLMATVEPERNGSLCQGNKMWKTDSQPNETVWKSANTCSQWSLIPPTLT